MTMTNLQIDALVSGLTPVRRVRPQHGMLLTLGAASAVILWVGIQYGFRPDIVAGTPDPLVIIRSGVLALMGLATGLAVTTSAQPAVGQRHNGWMWTLAAALLFPLAALSLTAWKGAVPEGVLAPEVGRYCLQISGIGALLIAGGLTMWLRTGAPVDINRAAWLTGLCAGSFGTFAYSLHCPSLSIYYIGLWYSLAVGISALAGRLIIPRLIRW
jgi:hypothetical protein